MDELEQFDFFNLAVQLSSTEGAGVKALVAVSNWARD